MNYTGLTSWFCACRQAFSAFVLFGWMLSGLGVSADVVTNVWTGGAGTTFWADPDNWESGVPQDGQILFFSCAQNTTFTNDLVDLAPGGIVISNTASRTLTFRGNAVQVDADAGMDILLQANSDSQRFDLPLLGTGTARLTSDLPNAGPIFYFNEENTQFAGRWVVDHAVLQCTNRFTVIGDDATETVIPDAITLRNGGNLKNYACNLSIPAWQGITLEEGGGGFCCGWSSPENLYVITVNSPITGDTPLGIAGATGAVLLNGTNTYAGGTFIGTNTWGSFVGQAGTHTSLILGNAEAIPVGTPVLVNGSYHGLLDLNGYSIQVSDLQVTSGATLANTSATESMVTADSVMLGGVLDGNIKFAGSIQLQVPDDSPWTNAVYEVTADKPLNLSTNGETSSGGATLLLNGGTVTLGCARGFGEKRTDGIGKLDNDIRLIVSDNFRGGTPLDRQTWSAASANANYYYQAMWYIEQDGIYSFGKSFDDAASIWIDGNQVLKDEVTTAEYSTYGYRLTQGWHLLQIWLLNKLETGGPQNGWKNGIKWSASNETLSATNGDIFYLTGANGDTHQFHFSAYITRPLLIGPDGGTVAQAAYNTFDAEFVRPPVVLCGGIVEAADNTAHTPVTLAAPTWIVPRGSSIPVFDAAVTLAEGASLTFSGAVVFKRMPTCAYSIVPGTRVFLTAETLSARAALAAQGAWIAYAPGFTDTLFQSEGNVALATGETMVVCFVTENGDELPTFLPNQSGSYVAEETFSVPAGAELVFDTARPWRQVGLVSGAGTVRYTSSVSLNLYHAWPDFNGTLVVDEVYHNTNKTIQGSGNAVHYLGFGESAQIVTRYGIINVKNVETTATLPPLTVYGGTLQLEHDANATSVTVDPSCREWRIKDKILTVSASSLSIPSGTELLAAGKGKLRIVLDNETLKLPFLTGNLPIEVTGTGTLNIDEFRQTYAGAISVSPTVAIQTGAMPAALPVIWLDAAASDTLIFDAGNSTQVIEWHDKRNGASGTTYPNGYLDTTMRNWKTSGNKWAYPPEIYEDASLATNPVLDFGVQNSGRWMAFTKPITMRTVLFVIGSQNGGGPSFFSATNAPSGYCRNGTIDGDNTVTKNSGIYNSGISWASPELANSLTRVDGVQVNPTSTGLSGGYQIITTRLLPDANSLPVSGISKDLRPLTGGHADEGKRSGGMRYAEILFYDRELTDAELAATENYLSQKWFGRVVAVNPPVPWTDFALAVTNTSTLQVDGEATSFALASLSGGGTLVKTGVGTIAADDTSAFTGGIDWREGGIASGISKNPAFWVDASVASSITEVDGRFVWRDCRWDGVTDYMVATQRWAVAPVVMTNEIGCLPVVNLGARSSTHDRGLQWSKKLSARAIFMVIGSQDSGGTILGTSDNACTFNRYNFTKASNPIYSEYTDNAILEGVTRLNGTVVNGLKTGFNGGYQVLTVLPTGGVDVGQFAHDRELDATAARDGGQRLAEVLIFTESISDSDVAMIESYLINKWKNNGDRLTLQGHSLPTVSVNGDAAATRTLTAWDELTVASLSGENGFAKTGTGELVLRDLSGFGGRITVEDGSLRLASLSSLLDDATFWVDASQGDSLTFAEGSNEVTLWRDKRGAGMYAQRAATETSTVKGTVYPNLNPRLFLNELNGLPTLDFGEWMGNRFLNWSKALNDIRTVFWVIGSQNGGGILLGYTGSSSIRDFYRAGKGETGSNGSGDYNVIEASNKIWTRAVASPILQVANAPTRLNGEDVDGCTVGLSGAYDIVSVRATANARASAFNMDRDRAYRNSTGGQRLAEVLVYNRVLTDDEATLVEAYLARKWGLTVTHAQPTNFTSRGEIQLAGGSLSVDDYADYTLASLGGVGSATLGTNAVLTVNGFSFVGTSDNADTLAVTGDLTLTSDAACAATLETGDTTLAPVMLAGTLTVAGGGTLAITGAEALPRTERTLLLSATSITGFDPADWKVTSDDSGVCYQLVQDGNALYLVPHAKGTLIFIR